MLSGQRKHSFEHHLSFSDTCTLLDIVIAKTRSFDKKTYVLCRVSCSRMMLATSTVFRSRICEWLPPQDRYGAGSIEKRYIERPSVLLATCANPHAFYVFKASKRLSAPPEPKRFQQIMLGKRPIATNAHSSP